VSSDPPAWQDSVDACATAVRDGRLAARSVAEDVLRDIARQDTTLNAFTYLEADEVLEQADRIDRQVSSGADPGPLAGVPVGVKDLYDVTGLPTSYGSQVFDPRPAQTDATAVRGLRESGALIIGKTRTAELAWSTITPPTSNPADPSRVAGGSSGGSASAVAAGSVLGALGTDTGGSIRIPAALCGVVGLKPTYGLIGRGGILPANWSLDTAGPITRSVADCRALLRAICIPDSSDPAAVSTERVDAVRSSLKPASSLGNVRLGVVQSPLFEILEPEVQTLFDAAIDFMNELGFEVVQVPLPEADWAGPALMAIDLPEGAAIHTERLRENGHLITDEIRSLLLAAHFIPGATAARGHSARLFIRDAVSRCFASHSLDVLAAPCNPARAVRHDDIERAYTRADGSTELAVWSYARPCWLANLTGQPALSLPLPSSTLPVGLQLIGRPFDEAHLLNIAEHIERRTKTQSNAETR
jgi:aspartyl-tRNA(Asn)/glutamyl-tRNA(Gln) amidotransferase subunit A